jgi:hypothetical protein
MAMRVKVEACLAKVSERAKRVTSRLIGCREDIKWLKVVDFRGLRLTRGLQLVHSTFEHSASF